MSEKAFKISSFHIVIHGVQWVIFTTPAQLLYETGGTSADGFWEVDLIDATNGCSENLYCVKVAEWEPGEGNMRLSASLQSATGETTFNVHYVIFFYSNG